MFIPIMAMTTPATVMMRNCTTSVHTMLSIPPSIT